MSRTRVDGAVEGAVASLSVEKKAPDFMEAASNDEPEDDEDEELPLLLLRRF